MAIPDGNPPVREMVSQAAESLTPPFKNAQIVERVQTAYPHVGKDTIQCLTIVCTVNQGSRVNWTENHKPRVACDPQYDFLYRVAHGKRVLYDAEVHGTWRIASAPDGALVVCCDDAPLEVTEPPAADFTPITPEQIAAAGKLFSRCPAWSASEAGFAQLREALPDFDLPSTLIKAGAVNDLYSTNVFGIWAMARHIVDVMPSLSDCGPVQAVLGIARPSLGTGGPTYRSFASKFAHFFIKPESYPIIDSFCELMVKRHLGKENVISTAGDPYEDYYQNLTRLCELSYLKASFRELDRYLWLGGQYREWLAEAEDAVLNGELQQLFEDECPGTKAELAQLMGALSDAA